MHVIIWYRTTALSADQFDEEGFSSLCYASINSSLHSLEVSLHFSVYVDDAILSNVPDLQESADRII